MSYLGYYFWHLFNQSVWKLLYNSMYPTRQIETVFDCFHNMPLSFMICATPCLISCITQPFLTYSAWKIQLTYTTETFSFATVFSFSSLIYTLCYKYVMINCILMFASFTRWCIFLRTIGHALFMFGFSWFNLTQCLEHSNTKVFLV